MPGAFQTLLPRLKSAIHRNLHASVYFFEGNTNALSKIGVQSQGKLTDFLTLIPGRVVIQIFKLT
jgi:hypothetical protein